MPTRRFVNVVQRHYLEIEHHQEVLFPLIEPLLLIPTHMSLSERLRLLELSMNLPLGFCACELGSYFGASTTLMAVGACVRLGQVHAVDTWKNDAMPDEMASDTYEEFLKNTYHYRHHITIHRGRAADMKECIPELHLLLIDGDHSYEGVLRDLTDYVPKLRPGGILAMHDFPIESVTCAVQDYFTQRPLDDLGCINTLQTFKV